MTSKLPTLLLAAVALIISCDKKPEVNEIDLGPPPPPSTVTNAASEPLRVSGVLPAKDGPELHWEQAFEAGHVTDLVACSGRLHALARGGRIVEWDPKTLTPKRVLTDFGAVTSIDADDRMLLAGTADGRVLRSTCEGREPSTSPDSSYPVRWIHVDPRSDKRAFVVFEEPPTKANGLETTAAAVALFDLGTGRAAREPFRRPWPAGGSAFGFVDYRGELWFGLTPGQGPSTVWYLERFDETQPSLAGLGDDVIRGFIQISREVWAYGGTTDGERGVIYRVDSNRAKPMWDGEEAWFGERPGGDLPTHPIVAMHKRDKELVVASTHGVFRVDKELRRWSKLHANDSIDDVLSTATPPVQVAKRIFLGTHHGVVAIDDESWSRATLPDHESLEPGEPPAAEATWLERVWSISDRGLHWRVPDAEKTRRFDRGPRSYVHGLHVDSRQRLWVFARDEIWLLTGIERDQQTRWQTLDIGLIGSRITSVAAGADDTLLVTTDYDADFRLRAVPPE